MNAPSESLNPAAAEAFENPKSTSADAQDAEVEEARGGVRSHETDVERRAVASNLHLLQHGQRDDERYDGEILEE
jgi:hypothetical protein